jgi:predicted TIM-barrel fold metal-dependent hydrolase
MVTPWSGPEITRRSAVKALTAGTITAGLSGCASWFCPAEGNVRSPLRRSGIDAHCHVFNASDLSAGEFFQRVVLHDHEDTFRSPPQMGIKESVIGDLGKFVIKILARNAPLAKTEADAIKRGEPVGLVADDAASDEQILKSILGGGSGAPAAPSDPQSPYLDAIKRELRKEGLLGPEKTVATEDIVTLILKSVGAFGRTVRWALLLLKSRRTIVDRLVTTYGGEGGINLFTPALVDFSYWLNEFPKSPFANQIEVMDLIQRQQTGPSMVHCFAPFNPLSQYMAQRDGGDIGETPLALVKRAIMEAGFIGVKLYPPMGFLPIDNRFRELTLPERFRNDPYLKGGLDQALAQLYAWCQDNDVAVMAHATDSNEALAGSGERASPVFWKPVLDRFRKLSLNLGHFGDFEEALESNRGRPRNGRKAWEQVIGELVLGGRDNLFADMSYMSELLGRNAAVAMRGRLRESLKNYLRNYDPRARSLLYGSDWIMLGREPQHKQYIGVITDFLNSAGLDEARLNRVFTDNAVRFLGLAPGRRTRDRLNRYYDQHQLDKSRLRVFDRV